jgi:hypothetical protein
MLANREMGRRKGYLDGMKRIRPYNEVNRDFNVRSKHFSTNIY